MSEGTTIFTISFGGEEKQLFEWVVGQSQKQYLGLPSVNAVIRRCIELVKEKNLLTEEK